MADPQLRGYNYSIRDENLDKLANKKGVDPNAVLAAGAINSADVFSGADCKVIFMVSPNERSAMPKFSTGRKDVQEMQTMTVTSSSSVMPVRRTGEIKPVSYGRGGRTFAGTMVFTVINRDPFMELFGVDGSSPVTDAYEWHVDQIPVFDAMIIAQNEFGGTGIQIVHGIRLVNWGTTYSVDDMFIESTYTYVAEHVSPFAYDSFDANVLYGVLQKVYGGVRDKDSEQRAKERLANWKNKIDALHKDPAAIAGDAYKALNKYSVIQAGASKAGAVLWPPEMIGGLNDPMDADLGKNGLFRTKDALITDRVTKYMEMFESSDANFGIDYAWDWNRIFSPQGNTQTSWPWTNVVNGETML